MYVSLSSYLSRYFMSLDETSDTRCESFTAGGQFVPVFDFFFKLKQILSNEVVIRGDLES